MSEPRRATTPATHMDMSDPPVDAGAVGVAGCGLTGGDAVADVPDGALGRTTRSGASSAGTQAVRANTTPTAPNQTSALLMAPR
ncbi:hypothetical protein GCM10017586_07900 [Microbacterium imperiale]|uniref:Uncharacterized protein n=1 Tax=Microbacterium imperiale TaxID=33884 RepID=A0A9W6M247_9MICO|nr:hypothetical protein GCM10017544_08730 [Microbacterium imperiale]GLJ79108.1 hypothetical protein GCM10017586_07900 [Microbacterium imperiale]